MGKWILDVDDDIFDPQFVTIYGNKPSTNHILTQTIEWDLAEELTVEYLNSLLERAYQMGVNDERIAEDEGCHCFTCKHHEKLENESPCNKCVYNMISMYERDVENEIKTGDVVIYNDTTKCVVINPETKEGYASLFDCNGVHYSAEHSELRKTGETCTELAELLKKMRGGGT